MPAAAPILVETRALKEFEMCEEMNVPGTVLARRRGLNLALAAIVGAACFSAVEAKATVIHGAFSGVVHEGSDYAGIFGPANAKLDGLRYVGSFTYDTDKGARHTVAGLDEISSPLSDQAVFAYALTINGITDTVDVSYQPFVATLSGHDFRLGAGKSPFIVVQEIAYGTAFDSLDAPRSFVDMQDGLGTPQFGVVQRFSTPSDSIYYANFDTERVDFWADSTPGGGVPEPATWALMLTGFAALGGSLRLKPRRAKGRRII